MSEQIAIRKLVARTPDQGEGPLAIRLLLARLLSGADLYPPEMPPSAVLMVRSLADPLPGRLGLDQNAVRVDPAWERAVRQRLAELWQSAGRPMVEAVPESAEAVRFQDRAEQVACLAADLVQGVAGSRWWWAEETAAGELRVAALLARHVRELPAIVAYLARRRVAADVVGALTPAEAMSLLGAMAGEAAAALRAEWRVEAAGEASAPTGATPGSVEADPRSQPSRWAEASPPPAPWEAHLPPGLVPFRLGRERKALLGVALMLARRPGAVRMASFRQALTAWWGGTEAAAQRLAEGQSPSSAPHRGQAAAARETQVPPRPTLRFEPAPEHEAAPQMSSWPAEFADGVQTKLGGVLYLINLMIKLDLPDCFPALSAEVEAWGTLEALARALLGPRLAEVEDDPIWAALASLDGREPRTLPGADYSGADPLELPPAWLAEYGVVVPTVPGGQAGTPLGRWLDLVVPWLNALLRLALRNDDVSEALLFVPGRLHVTNTHVDLVLPLDQARIEVRAAGLDANPGWSPIFRRIIAFHFRD